MIEVTCQKQNDAFLSWVLFMVLYFFLFFDRSWSFCTKSIGDDNDRLPIALTHLRKWAVVERNGSAFFPFKH